MATTEQPKDFSDLYTDLINRVKYDSSETATVTQAKRYINIALFDMHNRFREQMYWAERQATVITQQDYTTGTVSISQGSTSLTGSGTSWNTANAFGVTNARAGGKLKIGGVQEVYEVSSVDSDTGITLTTKYVGSDVSDQTYTYYEDEYDLASDFLHPLDFKFFDAAREIHILDRRLFRSRFIRNHTPGKITEAMIVERPPSGNTTPRRRVVFHRPPDDFYQVPYNYITSNLVVASDGTAQANLSADSDEPIVPLHARYLIVLHALFN